MADEIDLSEKFPDMQPISRLPSLSTVNGIGMRLTGSRDYDEQTNSYVTTHTFCLLFIPLFSFSAFRVINAPNGGWYFLGKVPLSGFAKRSNLGVFFAILLAIGGGVLYNHVTSAEYLDGRKMAEADALVEIGQEGKGAEIYRDISAGKGSYVSDARLKLIALIEKPPAKTSEALVVYKIVALEQRHKTLVVPNFVEQGLALVKSRVDAEPLPCLDILDAVEGVDRSKGAEFDQLRRTILEKLVTQKPNDKSYACRLSVVYDRKGEAKKCMALLQPFENDLGDHEAAAILGRLYSAKGENDKALKLLENYVEKRLPPLRDAEREYTSALRTAQNAVVEKLQNGTAKDFNFQVYEKALKDRQAAMVSEYISNHLKDDLPLRLAQEKIADLGNVVPAVLDLGMVQLRRAQDLPDPEQRRKELENAELTFLSVQGIAGDTDQYRLFLGQVYYWLGRHAEGKKLFDEMLTSSNRSSDLLFLVGQTLREIGDYTAARAHVEEAYNKEVIGEKKQNAAGLRAVMSKDLDDQINWLGRANTQDPYIKADLAAAKGQKALSESREIDAAALFSESATLYENMPQNVSTLNNGALAYFGLYRATRDRSKFDKGMEMIDRAVSLKPSDSIILQNAAQTLWEAAFRDLIVDQIDLSMLKRTSTSDLITYLYVDEAGHKAIIQKLKEHPAMIRSIGYFEKLLLVAPKQDQWFRYLTWHYSVNRDLPQLKRLNERLSKASLDQVQQLQEIRDAYEGKIKPNVLEDTKANLAAKEEVVKAARSKGGLTLSIALAELAKMKIAGVSLGINFDGNNAVKMTEEAVAIAPSEGARNALQTALEFRAHQNLIKKSPEYAAMAQKTKSTFSYALPTFYWGQKSGALHDLVIQDPDIKRYAELTRAYSKAFPNSGSPSSWAILQSVDALVAANMLKFMKTDPINQLMEAINARLQPDSLNTGLNQYWMLIADGKSNEALALLKGMNGKGIPMPIDSK